MARSLFGLALFLTLGLSSSLGQTPVVDRRFATGNRFSTADRPPMEGRMAAEERILDFQPLPDTNEPPPELSSRVIENYEDYFPEGDVEGIVLEGEEQDEPRVPVMSFFSRDRYTNYRSDESMLSFMPGNGEQFGWTSLTTSPYVAKGIRTGFNGVINIHWLSGPKSIPLPPRLYDFALGFQRRERLTEKLSYDVATSFGFYSDFEGSARHGMRMPSHAVGIASLNENTDLVLGVDYLARDDIKLLPAFGLSFHPVGRPALRFDLVFPRPRVDYALAADRRLYLAGFLDGGTWAVELPAIANDVMTYREYKLVLGYEQMFHDGRSSSCELGYVFDRQLEFRGLPGTTHFDDAFVIRFVGRK